MLSLSGFNNLSKTLVCNLYHLCYVENVSAYQAYIQQYDNSQQLTRLVRQLAQRIDAHIVQLSTVDYEPQGASLNLLLAEKTSQHDIDAHLDKSHIHLHTYPDQHTQNGVYAFRLDIDIASCGDISPLYALQPLLALFPASVIRLDYHVRGFTRQIDAQKCYQDQSTLFWITDYLSATQRQNYRIRQQQFSRLRASYAHLLCHAPQRVFLNAANIATQDYQDLIKRDMLALYQAL